MNDFLKRLLQNTPRGVVDSNPVATALLGAELPDMPQFIRDANLTRDLPMDLKFPMARPEPQAPLSDFAKQDTLGIMQGIPRFPQPAPDIFSTASGALAKAMSEQPANEQPPIQKPTAQKPAPPQAEPRSMPEQPQDAPPQEEDIISKLLKQRESDMSTADLMEGIMRVSTGIAGGGRLQYDPSMVDSMRKTASRPVEDVGVEASLSKARGQMNDDKAKRDPNSDISKISRSSVIDTLNKIGRQDLAAKVTANMSHQKIEDLFGEFNLQNMASGYEARESRKELAAMKAEQKLEAVKDKMDMADTKRLDAANKLVMASLARNNTAFGRSAGIIRSAEAIEQLVHGSDNLDPRQIKELAAALDSMLATGASTVSGRAGLVPSSWSGDVAKITEYITNIPRGTGQQKFVRRLIQTVDREKALAKSQINRESTKMLSSYADIQQRNPEAWNLMLQTHGLDPDIFKKEPSKVEEKSPKTTKAPKKEMPIDSDLSKMSDEELEAYIKAHGG